MNRKRISVPIMVGVLAVLFAAAGTIMAQPQTDRFPGPPDSDVRDNTPNDPGFDCAEPDDEDGADCGKSLFNEQFNLFGFAPAASRLTARYALRAPQSGPQISGVRADAAWKTTTGSSRVAIAIIDTGIDWDEADLRRKIWLNRNELPRPQDADGAVRENVQDTVFGGYDVDGDGAFTVDDYAQDPRVGDANDNDMLDGQDLIRAFSDGSDADSNGYVDDIVGWDFFNDDNDPADVSSYSAASNHGTGRATDAAAETNNGASDAGVCPRCRIMPMRLFDSFVAPADNYAAATVYAADNGAQVQEVALGLIQNTRAAKQATRYAFDNDMALMQVSSDLNTANHNYPTNYVGTTYVNGCVPDTAGLGTSIPGVSDLTGALDDLLNGLAVLPGIGDLLGGLGSLLGQTGDAQLPVATFFRNSNMTQFGAHAHFCMMGDTGSFATGQAAGAAGLVVSRGLEQADAIGGPLTSNEVKQILTTTAEDVVPGNTRGIGAPDFSQTGWDRHFGYGRVNLGAAIRQVAPDTIPPQALIEDPAWWAMLDPKDTDSVPIHGLAAAHRASGCTYELQWATGNEPSNDDFRSFDSGHCPGTGGANLGSVPLGQIADANPGSREGTPSQDPNEYVFTVRMLVTDDNGNVGRDRKTYFVFHDPTLHEGWPVFADTGGETSPVLYDLDGDGKLEIIDADSSGQLHARQADGTPLPSFNNGRPWQLPPTFYFHPQAPGFASGAVAPVTTGLRTPAVADIDGDLYPEIVVEAADGRLFVLSDRGEIQYQTGVDRSLSRAELRSPTNHVKPGFIGAPVIADLDRDGTKEIIAAALDGYIYVWSGPDGSLRSGFPVKLVDPDEPEFNGGEIIATPAVADLDGDGDLEIVSGSSEVYGNGSNDPANPVTGLVSGVRGLVGNILSGVLGGTSRLYTLEDDGSIRDGWPVSIAGVLPDILPLVGPNHATAVADISGDGNDQILASITTGDLRLFNGDGSVARTFSNTLALGQNTDPIKVFNLFEYPVVGDINGFGGPEVAKGGIGTLGVLNLLLVGQNLPFNHVMQAWNTRIGNYLPAFPKKTDDFQLLSTPTIADVDGTDGGPRQIIFGTGLYLIHAYSGRNGDDAPDFPKLTGGWIFNVPAIGDIDNDGKLELAAGTREGYRFVWDIDAPATPTTNSEWWTEAHDECNTNNYRMDCRPPRRITDLRLTDNDSLAFTAPGDDWSVGQARRYQVATAASAKNALTRLQDADTDSLMTAEPQQAGSLETVSLPDNGAFAAITTVDDAGNRAQPAIIDRATGESVDPRQPGGGGDGPDGDNGGDSNNGNADNDRPRSVGTGGCTLDTSGGFDPVWALMLLMAAGVLGWRRFAGSTRTGAD